MTSACDHSVSKYGIDSDPRVCSAVSLEYGESLVSEGAEWTQSSLGVCGQERGVRGYIGNLEHMLRLLFKLSHVAILYIHITASYTQVCLPAFSPLRPFALPC